MYILNDEQAKAINDAIEKYGKRSVLYINGIAHTIEEGPVGILLSAKKVDAASPAPVDPTWVMKLMDECAELPDLKVASAEPEIDVDGLRALLKTAEAERDAARSENAALSEQAAAAWRKLEVAQKNHEKREAELQAAVDALTEQQVEFKENATKAYMAIHGGICQLHSVLS